MSGIDGGDLIACWFESLKSGNREAVGPLWEHFFKPMVRLARATLATQAWGLTVADEEDAAWRHGRILFGFLSVSPNRIVWVSRLTTRRFETGGDLVSTGYRTCSVACRG